MKKNKPSKPRVISPEVKAKMLENLAAGRKKRAEMIASAKVELEKVKDSNKPPEIVIKKYVIKPNQFLKRKREELEKEKQKEKTPVETSEESIVETEDFTGAETDMELYKKIKRQERLLKKIKQVKQTLAPEIAPTQITEVPRVKPMVRMYSPFY